MLYFCFAGIVGDLELSRSPRVSIAQGVGTVGFTDGSLLQCVAKLHEIIGTGLMNLLPYSYFSGRSSAALLL